MSESGYAYFVKQPRILKDLFAIHAVDREHKYEVVKTIVLPLIDYENFITDMTVERQYLEDNAHLCEEGDIWKCLLIRRANKYDGVLDSVHTIDSIRKYCILESCRSHKSSMRR